MACPSRRPVVPGSSTPADPLLSTGHPGGGRTRRPPGPPRRCGGGLSSVTDLGARKCEKPNGTEHLWCYSPPTRLGEHPFERRRVEGPRSPGPAQELLISIPDHARCATLTLAKKEPRLLQ